MTEQAEQSDLRRRAAWLLGMLVVVAGLFVVLMLTLLNGSGGGGKHVAASIDPYASPSVSRDPSTAAGPSGASTGRDASSSATRRPVTRSCPSAQTCALKGDPGNAIAAVNAYRTEHGQQRVDGAVSRSAQACALSNGSTCSGGWVESEVANLDGPKAVQHIARFGNSGLLDSGMTSFEVGWAYDPGAHQYFIAIIHND